MKISAGNSTANFQYFAYSRDGYAKKVVLRRQAWLNLNLKVAAGVALNQMFRISNFSVVFFSFVEVVG